MASNHPFITDEQFELLLANGRLALACQETRASMDRLTFEPVGPDRHVGRRSAPKSSPGARWRPSVFDVPR